MTSLRTVRTRAALVALPTAALLLAGCAGASDDPTVILIGTTDKVTTLDPAGSYDSGSLAVQVNVFPYLVDIDPDSGEVVPSLADSAEFTAPNQYTVTLPERLEWANGNTLDAADVVFSFQRNLAIADPHGSSGLLANLERVEAVDETTVVFHLRRENDQIFPYILTSFPGAIVDDEVFAPDAITPDRDIVDANAFGGPYTITNWAFNQTVEFAPNPAYRGLFDAPANDAVIVSYYADSSNLALDVQEGQIDVAYRSLSAADLAELSDDENVTVHHGPGGEIRYLAFNLNSQPFGAATAEPDAAKALAVRQAVAHLIDRDALSKEIYGGAYTPLYSFVPDGVTGATEVLADVYGDGDGRPDAAQAIATLAAAGVTTPVALTLHYSAEHYGPNSADEFELIRDQLEAGGLFTVTLESAEWLEYSQEHLTDAYPAYQLGWFPDYADADNYLTPFFRTGNQLGNHFSDAGIDQLLAQQAVTSNAREREHLLEDIQAAVAALVPTVPYLQGAQTAVSGSDIEGIVLDASYKLRFATITR